LRLVWESPWLHSGGTGNAGKLQIIPLRIVKSRLRLVIAGLSVSWMFVMTDPHPIDVVLSAFAAGMFDEAQRVAIAKHLSECKRCRVFVHAMEHVGGMVLDGLPPTSLAGGSLTEVLARL
jgi:Putative zinc-finger